MLCDKFESHDEVDQRLHEESIVKILLKRYRMPDSTKWEMINAHEELTRQKRLALFMFFQMFPTFPVYLDSQVYRNLPKLCSIHRMFSAFDKLQIVGSYDSLLDIVKSRTGTTQCGLVFKWPYLTRDEEGGGNVVLHNYPINPDVPGTRIYWVSPNGKQLELEPFSVLLESIDRDWPSGRRWQPEPSER